MKIHLFFYSAGRRDPNRLEADVSFKRRIQVGRILAFEFSALRCFFSRYLCLCATALEGAGVDTKLLTDKFCGVEEPLLKKEYIFAFVACAYNAHNFLHNCA